MCGLLFWDVDLLASDDGEESEGKSVPLTLCYRGQHETGLRMTVLSMTQACCLCPAVGELLSFSRPRVKPAIHLLQARTLPSWLQALQRLLLPRVLLTPSHGELSVTTRNLLSPACLILGFPPSVLVHETSSGPRVIAPGPDRPWSWLPIT